MDPNNPNDPYYDPYDVYFKYDRERYLRGCVAYEEFVTLCDQEPGGRDRVKRERGHTYHVIEKRRNNV